MTSLETKIIIADVLAVLSLLCVLKIVDWYKSRPKGIKLTNNEINLMGGVKQELNKVEARLDANILELKTSVGLNIVEIYKLQKRLTKLEKNRKK